MLARKFIEFFLKAPCEAASQIVFTTHESTLLDLDLMRRDGIWFAEKDQAENHAFSIRLRISRYARICGSRRDISTAGSAYSLSGWHDRLMRSKNPPGQRHDVLAKEAAAGWFGTNGDCRDANLLVIATEDTYLPARYFDLFRNPRVKVQVLPTEDCRSSPEHVMDRLGKFHVRIPTGR